MKKITIKDIAEQAGVSKTAVSFAFNNPSKLPVETVERILEVADRLGYVPNPVARSLQNRRTGNIGLLFPQPVPQILANPHVLDLLRGVTQACEAAQYNTLLVSPSLGNMQQAVSEAVVDGFLTIGLEHYKSTVAILDRRGIPYVMIDSEPFPSASCVNIDDTTGAYQAMRHVLEHGHRNILIMAIESGRYAQYEKYVGTLQRRMSGYLQALAEFDLTIESPYIQLIEAACTRAGGEVAFRRILQSDSAPTAVVSMADVMAVGVLDAAAYAGISVPEQLSLVGFDNLPLSEWLNPGLTTVEQPVMEKGQRAAELLLDIIRTGSITPVQEVLPTRLVIRESVYRIKS
jgi:DNA-binding LacI/PurR family transcriptional regulator